MKPRELSLATDKRQDVAPSPDLPEKGEHARLGLDIIVKICDTIINLTDMIMDSLILGISCMVFF